MKKLSKYSGIFLIATGILHNIVGIIEGKDVLLAMLYDGLLDSVGENMERSAIFWFLMCGFIFILLGCALHHYIKKEQQLVPSFIGYSYLLLAIVGCFMMPVSGFWLFIPQAIIIIVANRK